MSRDNNFLYVLAEPETESALGSISPFVAVKTKVPVEALKKSLSEVLKTLGDVASFAEDGSEFEVTEIQVSVTVSASGDLTIGVASGQTTGQSTILLSLKRKNTDEKD